MKVNSYHDARVIVGEQCGGFQLTKTEGKENSGWYLVPTGIYDDYPKPPRNDLSPNWFVNRQTGKAYRVRGNPWTPLCESTNGYVYAADLLDSMTTISDR